ncbi:MAG: complex I NDUFA9 subunit family protein [Gammaproteobacteria bacterium]
MQPPINSTTKPRICILGGTGFVGQRLAAELSSQGYPLKVLTRRRERHRELLVLPDIKLVETDIHNQSDLSCHLNGCDIVINLVGILNEQKKGDFEKIHAELPGKIITACRDNDISRVIHVSALNADATKGSSDYLRTKGAGEYAFSIAGNEGLEVTILRPSVIFGPGDHFFNRFAGLLKISPVIFPLACPNARFAPVFVGDVVHALLGCIQNPATIGEIYNLCGPNQYTLRELVEFTIDTLRTERIVIELSDTMTQIQAKIMEKLPGKVLTTDNVLSMKSNNVCNEAFPKIFGIVPKSIESIVPTFLLDKGQRGRYYFFRFWARHES